MASGVLTVAFLLIQKDLNKLQMAIFRKIPPMYYEVTKYQSACQSLNCPHADPHENRSPPHEAKTSKGRFIIYGNDRVGKKADGL